MIRTTCSHEIQPDDGGGCERKMLSAMLSEANACNNIIDWDGPFVPLAKIDMNCRGPA